MTLQKIFAQLKMTGLTGLWEQAWEVRQDRLPDLHDELADAAIALSCQTLGMAGEPAEACRTGAAWIRSDPAALAFARLCHDLFFNTPDIVFSPFTSWPMPSNDLDERARMFYAIVFLSGFSRIWNLFDQKSIPQSVRTATLKDLELWIGEYRRQTGRWGFREIGWLQNHFRGKLYQLGRLQFELSRMDLDFRIYQNADQGAIVAVAEEGLSFRPDGQFDGTNGIHSQDIWRSALTEDDQCVSANPVSPQGSAIGRKIRLDKRQWTLLARRGDSVLGVHIPAQGAFHGPMTAEACDDSFRQARTFFPQYFPEFSFRGFTTHSWLVDGQLADYLPPTSNIVRFQQRFYLLPLPDASDAQTVERIFGGKPITDWKLAPQETSLQRTAVRHVLSGRQWRMGGGFIPRNPAGYVSNFAFAE